MLRVEGVLRLIHDGEISRAMGLLHSYGIAGITEDVLRQLASKCPLRSRSVPAALPGAAPHAVTVQLTGTFRGLRRRAGTGVGGRRNEYLRALVGTFGDPLCLSKPVYLYTTGTAYWIFLMCCV